MEDGGLMSGVIQMPLERLMCRGHTFLQTFMINVIAFDIGIFIQVVFFDISFKFLSIPNMSPI